MVDQVDQNVTDWVQGGHNGDRVGFLPNWVQGEISGLVQCLMFDQVNRNGTDWVQGGHNWDVFDFDPIEEG